MVKLLLSNDDVDPDCKDKYGRTPLWYAAANMRATVVKLLLTTGDVDPNAEDTKSGSAPLHALLLSAFRLEGLRVCGGMSAFSRDQ
jgi:ankyrin repeat protein